MHFFHKIFLISFIFLSILVFEYQSIETNLENQAEKQLDLLFDDTPISSQGVKNLDSSVNLLNENNEVKNQQKRQARKKGSKVTKRPVKKTTKRRPTTRRTTKRIPTTRRTTKRIPTTRRTTRRIPTTRRTTRRIPTTRRTTRRIQTTRRTTKKITTRIPTTKKITTTTTATTTTTTTMTTTTTEEVVEEVDEFADLKESLYDSINELRGFHHADALDVSPIIAQEAQERANLYAENAGNAPEYDGPLGEIMYNIDVGVDIEPLDHWTDGAEGFDFEDPENTPGFDAFTQLIWVSTTEIGCGVSASEDTTFVVCRFSPKGNTEGEYADNVLPE